MQRTVIQKALPIRCGIRSALTFDFYDHNSSSFP
jgi:hypothetical protein